MKTTLVSWPYLQKSVVDFPTEAVDVLIRWFSGNREGLTIFNVIESVLILSAYFAGKISGGTAAAGTAAATKPSFLLANDEYHAIAKLIDTITPGTSASYAVEQSGIGATIALEMGRRFLLMVLNKFSQEDSTTGDIARRLQEILGI